MLNPVSDLIGERISVTPPGAFLNQLPQVGGLGVPVRDREMGKQHVAELQLEFNSFGHCECVIASARIEVGREQPSHLGSSLEVVILAVELEPARLIDGRTRLDTQENVVRFGLALIGVVRIVGGKERSVDLLGDLNKVGKDALLGLEPMILQLDVEVVSSEDVLVLGGGPHRRVEVADLAQVAFLLRGIGSQ